MSHRHMLAATLFAISAGGFASTCYAASLGDVKHIYLENHSFDNLFGFFPNADGIAAAGATKIQVDRDGHPYDFLPRPMETIDLSARKKVEKRLSVNPFRTASPRKK
jgi:phospholipase C